MNEHTIYEYVDRDTWEDSCLIGLQSVSWPRCNCDVLSSKMCKICRATWGWDDGTHMSWWLWRDSEPNSGHSCGRLTSDSWVDADCDDEARYICERGEL